MACTVFGGIGGMYCVVWMDGCQVGTIVCMVVVIRPGLSV